MCCVCVRVLLSFRVLVSGRWALLVVERLPWPLLVAPRVTGCTSHHEVVCWLGVILVEADFGQSDFGHRYLTDFGQTNFGQSFGFRCLKLVVWIFF